MLVAARAYKKGGWWCRYAGVPYNADELDLDLGDIALMRKGQPLQFDAKAASKYLTDTTAVHGTVHITLSLGSGSGAGKAWVRISYLLGLALLAVIFVYILGLVEPLKL